MLSLSLDTSPGNRPAISVINGDGHLNSNRTYEKDYEEVFRTPTEHSGVYTPYIQGPFEVLDL